MSRPIVWECDGCGTRDEENGHPGAPPDGWTRVEAKTFGKPHYLPYDGDYCPECAKAVDCATLGTSRLMYPPKPPKAKRGQRQLEEEEPELFEQ